MYKALLRAFDRWATAWLEYRLGPEPYLVSPFEHSCAEYIEDHAYGVVLSDATHGAAFVCLHHVH